MRRVHLPRCLLIPGLLLLAVAGCDEGSSPDPGPQVNGRLEAVVGGSVLYVHGTHAERGYAHGYLCAGGIMDIFEGLFVGQLFSASDSLFSYARGFIAANFVLEQRLRDEAGGMVRGMDAAGVDLRSNILGRDIDSMDLLTISCLEELLNIITPNFPGPGCSSLSCWGDATLADPVLAGETVITRHWDYILLAQITRNLLMVVHTPSESDERGWVSCGWAGNIGSCSGLSSDGVGALLNYGNIDTLTGQGPFQPVSFALRSAIERADLDGSGIHGPSDVTAAFRRYPARFAAIIHVVTTAAADTPAMVIEVNTQRGVAVRTGSGDTVITGPYLLATNHFRVLYPPVVCDRYAYLADSLRSQPAMSAERDASMLAGAAGWPDDVYRVQYVPGQGTVRWGCSTTDVPAHQRPWNEFSMAQLFAAP